MKIIILGAGQVGGTLAEHLSGESNDITVVDTDGERLQLSAAEDAERKRVRDILSKDRNPSARIDEPAETLVSRTAGQNYVPIVDDRGVFIGIVTRRNVIRYFLESK